MIEGSETDGRFEVLRRALMEAIYETERLGVDVPPAQRRYAEACEAQAESRLRAAMLDGQPAVRVHVADLERALRLAQGVSLRVAEGAGMNDELLVVGAMRLRLARYAAERREAAETDLAAAMQEGGPPVEVDCVRLGAAILEAVRWEVAVEVARDRALL